MRVKCGINMFPLRAFRSFDQNVLKVIIRDSLYKRTIEPCKPMLRKISGTDMFKVSDKPAPKQDGLDVSKKE